MIGFDYWQVLSHYPEQIALIEGALHSDGQRTCIISAVGKSRQGTVEQGVLKAIPDFDENDIHEVVFTHPRESPELKLAKCKELGVTIFFDDREDVCDLLNQNGILAFRVPRKQRGQTDEQGEQRKYPTDTYYNGLRRKP